MESESSTHSQASSTSLGDESVKVSAIAESTTTSGSMDDTDGIGEVWYRPPIPDPVAAKPSLRLRTNRVGKDGPRREELSPMSPSRNMETPVLERSATALSCSTRGGRSDGEPVLKRKKSFRVVASQYKKSLDEALRAFVGSSSPDLDAPEQSRAFKRLLKRKVASDSDLDSLPTTTFKWVRGEPIGDGTRMYAALNIKTGEMMALKQAEIPLVKKKHWTAKQMENLERLKKEARILVGLEHPNVVQYLGCEETQSIYNLFLGYVSGGSVGAFIRSHGKLQETIVIFFLEQIVDGVEYLHSKGIIHRDLFADNILMEINGVIKISGFGASEKVPETTLNRKEGSEVVYRIAPEVMNLQRNGNNFKVDIWSVGCLFLEMMTGLGPWSEVEMIDILFQLSQVGSPVTPAYVTLSELAEDFRRDCLALDPHERASASELRTHRFLELPVDWYFNDSN
ncbi:hypothetical protein E1B28_000311 [Marasmius oreades]|uniref:Protein kinase domain-containing protein n=1 Tax=Marasmius oreades TaxID=181124 RepID=A0A9P8AE79_9AGAR|nr:uncharacterized protein E1B28_000311 [Marasmius oreades]KAG7098352.1 hypothetical protein E1B28_000311 [Marasmius oreades]